LSALFFFIIFLKPNIREKNNFSIFFLSTWFFLEPADRALISLTWNYNMLSKLDKYFVQTWRIKYRQSCNDLTMKDGFMITKDCIFEYKENDLSGPLYLSLYLPHLITLDQEKYMAYGFIDWFIFISQRTIFNRMTKVHRWQMTLKDNIVEILGSTLFTHVSLLLTLLSLSFNIICIKDIYNDNELIKECFI